MSRTIALLIMVFASNICFASNNVFVKMSQDLLAATQNRQSTDKIVAEISNLSLEQLESGLKNDDEKFAFWLNIYNGFIQVILSEKPELYEDRGSFFKIKMIKIAGQDLAFADIEHGIIRHSQYEYFLGYITNPFAPAYEKKLRVDEKDFRVHFALNCGAKDCPPVAIYDDLKLDSQLDQSTTRYLKEKTSIRDGAVYTTTLFKWFRGDFGGGDGIRKIIEKYTGIKVGDRTLNTETYDWTLSLGNFIELT